MERFDGYFDHIKEPTTFFVIGSSVSFEKVVIFKDNKSGRLPFQPGYKFYPSCFFKLFIPLTGCWFNSFIAQNFIDRTATERSNILWNDLMAI
jgi:hypothetical protein